MIYALVFFVVILNTYLFVHVKRRENAKWPLFFLLIAFNAITILAAFRGNTGTDTLKFYEPFYEKYILYGSKYQGIEFGFYWLCKFGYALFNSFEGVLFTIATVIWFNFFYVIKYFKNLKINLVIYSIFLISFYMGPSMNIMRQLVATSFFLIAITKILEHKLWQYIVWIIVASLFHTSAIILLPIYFLYVDIENKKYKNFFFTLMICLLPVIFFLFFKVVINIPIFSKYKSIYGENLEFIFRPQRLVVRLPLYIFELWLVSKMHKKFTSKDSFYCKLILLEVASLFIGYFSLWAYRLLYYFTFGHILLITSITDKYNKKNRTIIYLFFLYCILYFYVSHILFRYDEIYPYNLIN